MAALQPSALTPLPGPPQIPLIIARDMQRSLQSGCPETLSSSLNSYLCCFFSGERFVQTHRSYLYPKRRTTDPAVIREEEYWLFQPYVHGDKVKRRSHIPRGVHPAELTPSRYPYGTWKSPNYVVARGGAAPWGDQVVLIVEVRKAGSNVDKARGELCAYLEAAVGRNLASPVMRGMLVFQTTFDVFEVVEGKAVLVSSGLVTCGPECVDFLFGLANQHP